MSKPVIHVPLDLDELQLLIGAVELLKGTNTGPGAEQRAIARGAVLDLLRESFTELAKLSNQVH